MARLEIEVMTNWQIVILCLAVSVLVSSILVVVFRRKGWNDAANMAARFEQLAAAAMSGKDSGEALKIVLDEILNPATETVPSQRATEAALKLAASIPPPPRLPTKTGALAGVLPLGLLAIAVLQSSGCTQQQAQSAAGVALAKAPEIVGGACAIAEALGGGDTVKVICKVLQGGGDGVIHDMSTGPSVETRPATYATVEFVMPRAEAEALVAKNGGAK